jgi:hypothetical protein
LKYSSFARIVASASTAFSKLTASIIGVFPISSETPL